MFYVWKKFGHYTRFEYVFSWDAGRFWGKIAPKMTQEKKKSL